MKKVIRKRVRRVVWRNIERILRVLHEVEIEIIGGVLVFLGF